MDFRSPYCALRAHSKNGTSGSRIEAKSLLFDFMGEVIDAEVVDVVVRL